MSDLLLLLCSISGFYDNDADATTSGRDTQYLADSRTDEEGYRLDIGTGMFPFWVVVCASPRLTVNFPLRRVSLRCFVQEQQRANGTWVGELDTNQKKSQQQGRQRRQLDLHRLYIQQLCVSYPMP